MPTTEAQVRAEALTCLSKLEEWTEHNEIPPGCWLFMGAGSDEPMLVKKELLPLLRLPLETLKEIRSALGALR